MLPAKPPYKLSMDRTDWKFDSLHINILLLAVNYNRLAFPLVFKVLTKSGNSSTPQHIEIMQDFIKLLGEFKIESFLADREFIGQRWLKWLNLNNIHYYIRIRNNTRFSVPRKNKDINNL